MRLTLSLLGWDLDITLGQTFAADEPDPLRDLGTTGCYPISFVGEYDVPADMPWVERNNGWGDDEE